MDTREFYRILDIDDADGFVYYDNFAALAESEEDIPYDLVYDLCLKADEKTLADLCDDYFAELLEEIPADQEDLYILTENIQMGLKGILEGGDEDRIARYAEELMKFREWFTLRRNVAVEDVATGSREEMSVRGAVVRYNAEQYMDEESRFFFDDALDYDLDEYVFTVKIDKDYDYEPSDEDDDGYDRRDDYWEDG